MFKLSNLVQLYKDRLVQLKVISPSVHSTRLKDQILAHFPELQAFKEGHDILLMSNKDIGFALRKVCVKMMQIMRHTYYPEQHKSFARKF